MSPWVEGTITGLIANGLTALAGHLWRETRGLTERKEELRQLLAHDTALTPILQKAAVSVARAIPFDESTGNKLRTALVGSTTESQVEKLRLFLVSPDVDTVVRQLYASRLTTKPDDNLESIRTAFLTSLSLRLGTAKENLGELADHLFEALLKGCERALAMAIDKGILSAHEAKSAARHRLILDELATIQKNLTLLTAPDELDIQAILKFEERYRQQVGSRHAHITPPHFDVARRLPLDRIYVPPNVVREPQTKDEDLVSLTMPAFLATIYRAVLLGNPGGGKSTFTDKLCHDLSLHHAQRLFAGRQVTPVHVVLRDYGAEKKTRRCSILQFIETTANAKYQVESPPGAFDYLLLNGHVVVIFDGLDELLDTSYRREISGDIESFCTLYPSVPVLVTSREVGYEQAPLDEKTFEVFRLSDFDDDQVRDYATKWFAIDTDLPPEQQGQKTAGFLEESQIVLDLRANPLMLALMCNLYRVEGFIPRNRPDVYEKCAVMLFERWDKSRGIHAPLPFEAHIRPAMMHLAHWIYGDETLQGGVSEPRLIAETTAYLCPRRFEDRDEAEAAAREFIEFCRGRAWVFTDTGTMTEGERLYQFTHRTFLEYFTSAHLVRTHETADELAVVLFPRIARREWDVVAQLAFQIKNKQSEGAGDKLFTALLEQANEADDDSGWSLLTFAARCLEFMVPSPKTTRDLTTACIRRCLVWGLQQKRRNTDDPEELLSYLLHAATENRLIVADSLEKLLIEKVNSGSEQEAILALEVGLNLEFPLHVGLRIGSTRRPEIHDFWKSVSDRLFDACASRIEALRPRDLLICMEVLWRGKGTIDEVVEWHGIESIFHTSEFRIFPTSEISSFADSCIRCVQQHPRYQSDQLESQRYLENMLHRLEDLACILISSPTPWIRHKESDPPVGEVVVFDEYRLQNANSEKRLILSSDALFVAFMLLAVVFEENSKNSRREKNILASIKNSRLPFFNSIRFSFLARFEPVETDKVQAEMDRCGFTSEQQEFAWRWIRRDIDLVQIDSE